MRSPKNLAAATALACCLGVVLAAEVAAQIAPPKPVLLPKAASPPKASAAPSPAAQPVSADPQSTSATYGDWVMRCRLLAIGDQSQRFCEVAQTMQVQGQPGPVAELALGRPKKDDPIHVTVVLPVNVMFPSAPKVTIDDKQPTTAELVWQRCQGSACFADTALSEDVMSRWRAETGAGRIESKDATGRDFVLNVSFRGLAQALDALAKQ